MSFDRFLAVRALERSFGGEEEGALDAVVEAGADDLAAVGDVERDAEDPAAVRRQAGVEVDHRAVVDEEGPVAARIEIVENADDVATVVDRLRPAVREPRKGLQVDGRTPAARSPGVLSHRARRSRSRRRRPSC